MHNNINARDIKTKPMQSVEIGDGLKLSSAENWNQTEEDWKFLVDGGENICLAAEYKGEIVATTAAVNYSGRVAWIAMVLVNKRFRGLGISAKLLREAISRLQGVPSIKLDATPAGKPVYEKFGFNEEYTIYRMALLPAKSRRIEPVAADKTVRLSSDTIEEAVRLDHVAFGANRGSLIRALAKRNPGLCWVIRDKCAISGFVLGRAGRRYIHIGPVCARAEEDAKALIAQAIHCQRGRPFIVDVPESKKTLVQWLKDHGFSIQRPFTRMYMGENPLPGDADKRYLICGPEFG